MLGQQGLIGSHRFSSSPELRDSYDEAEVLPSDLWDSEDEAVVSSSELRDSEDEAMGSSALDLDPRRPSAVAPLRKTRDWATREVGPRVVVTGRPVIAAATGGWGYIHVSRQVLHLIASIYLYPNFTCHDYN